MTHGQDETQYGGCYSGYSGQTQPKGATTASELAAAPGFSHDLLLKSVEKAFGHAIGRTFAHLLEIKFGFHIFASSCLFFMVSPVVLLFQLSMYCLIFSLAQ